jgi:prepilin-type N-terminal cleavage/methylation domain-containing protein
MKRFINRHATSVSSARGFTIIELLVSISILLIISVFVANDINRSRYQEELNGSARILAATMQDLRAKALAATSVQTCAGPGSAIYVCELNTNGCSGACGTMIAPAAVGITIIAGSTGTTVFAEPDPVAVAPTNYFRAEDTAGNEDMAYIALLTGRSGSNDVTINGPIVTNTGNLFAITVTFERQSGTMRINACGTPTGAPPCSLTEPTTAVIPLRHAKTLQVRTVTLNTITGKISIE